MQNLALGLYVTLFMAPQTKGCLKCPVADFAHVLPLKCQGRERRCMIKESVSFLSATGILGAVGQATVTAGLPF